MPFIKGRYHMNPIAGQALESAREAEAALLALEQAAKQQNGGDGSSDASQNYTNAPSGPIHRVEIEAAELVPSHSGRAARGFVARVHRAPNPSSVGAQSAAADAGEESWQPAADSPSPETHVFANHHDLVNFLRDEFAKDCARH